MPSDTAASELSNFIFKIEVRVIDGRFRVVEVDARIIDSVLLWLGLHFVAFGLAGELALLGRRLIRVIRVIRVLVAVCVLLGFRSTFGGGLGSGLGRFGGVVIAAVCIVVIAIFFRPPLLKGIETAVGRMRRDATGLADLFKVDIELLLHDLLAFF